MCRIGLGLSIGEMILWIVWLGFAGVRLNDPTIVSWFHAPLAWMLSSALMVTSIRLAWLAKQDSATGLLAVFGFLAAAAWTVETTMNVSSPWGWWCALALPAMATWLWLLAYRRNHMATGHWIHLGAMIGIVGLGIHWFESQELHPLTPLPSELMQAGLNPKIGGAVTTESHSVFDDAVLQWSAEFGGTAVLWELKPMTYRAGDRVVVASSMYRCLRDHQPLEFNVDMEAGMWDLDFDASRESIQKTDAWMPGVPHQPLRTFERAVSGKLRCAIVWQAPSNDSAILFVERLYGIWIVATGVVLHILLLMGSVFQTFRASLSWHVPFISFF